MDGCFPTRLKLLTVLLLTSANVVSLQGNPNTGPGHDLRCVNDYLFTVNCSLHITPSDNTSGHSISYWLLFEEIYEQLEFVCLLTNTGEDYFCSAQKSDPNPSSQFYDLNEYEISLCHNQTNGSDTCELLESGYEPKTNIKPNPPCCLTVRHNASRRHFSWKSTYEEFTFSSLDSNLKYQLYFYKGGDKNYTKPLKVNTDSKAYSLDEEVFVPDTLYMARVRSSPNQAISKGQWSDWSPEVYWKTQPAVDDPPMTTSLLGSWLAKVFIPVCAMVVVVSLLCYAPIKRWRQSAFIPTPAPYFRTLYSDCQGDFKSWVVTQEKTADMLKEEETLHIDTLTKCADVPEEVSVPQLHHRFTEGSGYSNVIDLDCDFLGAPDAAGTRAPQKTSVSSLKSLSLQPWSPAEGDSGCWLCSHTSLEVDAPFYCNEYCTLSAFQQTSSVTAEDHGSPSGKLRPAEGTSLDDVTEASAGPSVGTGQ